MKCIWVLLALLAAAPLLAADTDSQETKIQELEQKIRQLQAQLDALKSAPQETEISELRRDLTVLAEEVQKLRSGEEEEVAMDDAARTSLGLGPSASKVYSKKQGVSIAGYGEMLYENFEQDESDRIDFLRAVLYAGYRFNDRFLFNSEIEFEHASTGEGSEELGEASVEFAHIDYRMNDDLTLRGGLVLVPMGLINEFHEPNVYLGARRPVTETTIIPSTWSENGFGIAGRSGTFDYRAYLIAGLNAAGISAEEGFHEARQHGSNSRIHPAFVGRLDVTPRAGLLFGGSVFAGNSGFFGEGEEEGDPAGRTGDFRTVIGEFHGQYRARGLDLQALYAHASVDNAAELNALLDLEGASSIGSSMNGGYIQAGYDVLARRSNEMSLVPYVRFEKVNTQSDVPTGFLKDPALDLTIWTFGAQFKPIPNIVIKADYQSFDPTADQFNINLGYSF